MSLWIYPTLNCQHLRFLIDFSKFQSFLRYFRQFPVKILVFLRTRHRTVKIEVSSSDKLSKSHIFHLFEAKPWKFRVLTFSTDRILGSLSLPTLKCQYSRLLTFPTSNWENVGLLTIVTILYVYFWQSFQYENVRAKVFIPSHQRHLSKKLKKSFTEISSFLHLQ